MLKSLLRASLPSFARLRRAAQTFVATPDPAAAAAPAPASGPAGHPVTFSIYERARNDNWQWFAAPPFSDNYFLPPIPAPHQRRPAHPSLGLAGELAQTWVGGVPKRCRRPPSPRRASSDFGGTYYAANGNNSEPAAAFFKQGFLRYQRRRR